MHWLSGSCKRFSNSITLQRILGPHAIPSADNKGEEEDSRPHVSRLVTTVLTDHNIKVMDRPANCCYVNLTDQ